MDCAETYFRGWVSGPEGMPRIIARALSVGLEMQSINEDKRILDVSFK
jgi:hypothetical protein